MAFGRSKSSGPWPVDVLTLEYLVSGEVDEPGQKWGWNYFQTIGQNPGRPFDAMFTRVDGADATPIQAPRATLVTRFLHTGAETA